MQKWHPGSWKDKAIYQLPDYKNQEELNFALKELSVFPPLVFAGEVRKLKKKLADVCEGKAFLLQGGECAESFEEFRAHDVRDSLRVLMQMAAIIMYSVGCPIVKMGRIAGQFAKPRSEKFEERDGVKLPVYRGDMVNDLAFTEESRNPNPQRLLTAYHQAAATLNLLRAFTEGGYADLHRVHQWNLDFMKSSPLSDRFKFYADQISQAIRFMEAAGINQKNHNLRRTSFFASHEALHLWYEEALTRQDSITGQWVDCSGHFLWIGDRTRQLDSAHVEFLRGVINPIGIKCGPNLDPEELIELIDILNPENEPGRITCISRMGADKISEKLPKLIQKVQSEGKKVVWSCDPMHGNTFKTTTGVKTRAFQNVLREMQEFFSIHQAEGSYAGGIHLEMTGQDVTECIGGAQDIDTHNLSERYETRCDPRLNASQSLELSLMLSDSLQKLRGCLSNENN